VSNLSSFCAEINENIQGSQQSHLAAHEQVFV